MERFQQLRTGGQPERKVMYGLAWSRGDIAVWRFAVHDGISYITTGLQSFTWDAGNGGYQVRSQGQCLLRLKLYRYLMY